MNIFFEKVIKQQEQKLPFVLYCKPNSDTIIGMFQHNDTLFDVVDFTEKGFVKVKVQKSWEKEDRFRLKFLVIDSGIGIPKGKVDYISRAISLETGKNLNESKAEVIESLHMAQYCFGKGREVCGEIIASELADRDSCVIRKPKGVIASISCWNFPFAIGGFWVAGPALLEGNTVVLKPCEDTPMVGQIIAELYDEAGFPPGVFNLVHGDGRVGDYLARHKEVDHICFTGSAEVGKHIRQVCAQSWHKTCSCELGGKSAVIVFEDADMDLAIDACIASAFKLSGQRCVSSGRMLVHRSIYDLFSHRFVEKASKIKVGDPFEEPDSMFGPLINHEQMIRVHEYNEMTYENGTKVLLAGECPDRKGYFMTPHVYQTEWRDRPYLKQEVFGPHVALVPFNDLDDAVRIYNDTEYGLSLGCITNDYRKMREIRNRCDSGIMYFNLGSVGAESHASFGGVKKSGNGQPSAAGTFDSVVHKVTVSVNHAGSINFPQGLT